MKLYSTTYSSREIKKEISALLGKPYTLLSSLRKGGSGSHRMILSAMSPKLEALIGSSEDIIYGSIELRPKGILFHITKGGLKSWAWAIPYYKLTIYQCTGFTVYSNTDYIHVKPHRYLTQNQKFIQKLNENKKAFVDFYTHPELIDRH